MEYTEEELNKLITHKIENECGDFPNLCHFTSNEVGKKRVFEKVKELIFTENVTDIDACFAHIESELEWGEQG